MYYVQERDHCNKWNTICDESGYPYYYNTKDIARNVCLRTFPDGIPWDRIRIRFDPKA